MTAQVDPRAGNTDRPGEGGLSAEVGGGQAELPTVPPASLEHVNDVAGVSSFARTTRASAIYGAGLVTTKLVGLLLLPILTRFLTPAEFGSMDVLQSLQSALLAVVLLGLDVASLRLYFDQPDALARRRLVGTAYGICLSVTLAAGTAIALLSAEISEALFGSSDLQLAVVAVAGSLIAAAVKDIALAILRAQGRVGWYSTLASATHVTYAVLAVALMVVWTADANAVLIAYALALALSAVAGTFLIRAEAFGRPSAPAGRALLRVGLPLTPAAAAVYIASFLNRMILLGAAGVAEVALFSVAMRITAMADVFVSASSLAWQPRAFALGSSAAARDRLAADAPWIVATVCAAVTAVAVVSPEVIELISGGAYRGALAPLGFCLVAILMGALFLVASIPSAVAKATEDIAAATAIGVFAGVAGNFALAPSWHSTGAAAAVAAGELVRVVLVGLLGRRHLPLPVDWVRLGGLVAITSLVAIALPASGASLPIRLLVGAAMLALIASSVPLRPVLARIWIAYLR